MSKNQAVELAKMQQEIATHLGLDSSHIVFDFREKEGFYKLHLITVNPRHEQSFLFRTEKGLDKLEAMEKMLEYVNKHYSEENTYTIQWSKNGESELQTSYFRGHHIYDALDKFYFDKELNSYTVFKVTLNPIA